MIFAASTTTWDILVALGLFTGGMTAAAGLLMRPLRWAGKKIVVEPIKEWHTSTTLEMLDQWGDKRLFSPNSGKSLYDIGTKVDKIADDVTTLTGRVTVLEESEST